MVIAHDGALAWRGPPKAIVAVPACNEEAALEGCLAALAMQRDDCGAPLPGGMFEVVIYANNCSDRTAERAETFATVCPHPVVVVSAQNEAAQANAGRARRTAMDLAADRLEAAGRPDGIILTTDADSTVSPTWISSNIAALTDPVDAVAGYIDAFPVEMMRLEPHFVQRGRLEDRYLRLIAEIYARCDPRLHDPWPNHRVSSGASLAVSLRAYRTVGGLPAIALGEDAAFTRLLEGAGFKVRRPMSVTVGTSCRFDGRAKGGAADTMRRRHEELDTPCDDDIEPAPIILRRALWRGAMRRAHAAGTLRDPTWARRLGWGVSIWRDVLDRLDTPVFEALWTRLEADSPALSRRHPLRPADLPGQIVRAEAILGRLRGRSITAREAAPTDKRRRSIADVSVAA